METKITTLLGVVCALVVTSANSSGFRLPESTVSGMSSSNAMVADSSTTAAASYNPATIAFQENFVAMDFTGLKPDIAVTPAGSAASVDSSANTWHLLPSFYYARRLDTDISFGLGVNAPFGLATDWPENTFPLPAGVQPTLSQIKMYNVTPNIVYRMDNTSVALGVNFYRLTKLAFNTDLMTISGDGDGIGYTLAALHKQGAFSFGLSYRSAVDADITGSQNFPSTSVPATLTLGLPSMMQIGVNWAVSDRLAVEFDIERTGWSSFDTLRINHADSGANLITSANNWRDANAYRLGGTFNLNDKTTLRAGYSYDLTAQPDAYFSARLADNDRQLFSAGIEHDMGRWKLSAGFMHVLFKDRSASNSVPFGSYGTDANGTAAYNGNYQSSVNLIGLGFSVPL